MLCTWLAVYKRRVNIDTPRSAIL